MWAAVSWSLVTVTSGKDTLADVTLKSKATTTQA